MPETPPVSPQPHGVHELPAPSLWPAALAMGSTLLMWGVITSAILTSMGLTLFALALAGWIGEIRHERRKQP